MKYSVSGVDITGANSPQSLINIFSVAGIARGKIYEMICGSNATPDDQTANLEFVLTTGNGTEGSGWTPRPLDPDGPPSNFDAGIGHSAQPPEVADSRLLTIPINKRNTFRWVAKPDSELILPKLANNGICLLKRTSTADYTFNATILFEE